MKSEKNILRDIFRAQGIYVHGDIPEPTSEALSILHKYGFEKWKEGNDDGYHDASY